MQPGAYILRRSGRVAYTGRSDKNVVGRAVDSSRFGPYDSEIEVRIATSARQAYLEECRLYHRHRPADNDRHPAVPPGANWRCPVRGCPWS